MKKIEQKKVEMENMPKEMSKADKNKAIIFILLWVVILIGALYFPKPLLLNGLTFWFWCFSVPGVVVVGYALYYLNRHKFNNKNDLEYDLCKTIIGPAIIFSFLWYFYEGFYKFHIKQERIRMIAVMKEKHGDNKYNSVGYFLIPELSDKMMYNYVSPYSEVGQEMLVEYGIVDKSLHVIEDFPDSKTKFHYQQPVRFFEDEEIGNDYFYYGICYPKQEYRKFGYNIVYVADYDTLNKVLNFTDINNSFKSISYEPKNYDSIPDKFLVFENINKKINKNYTVCLPELNTFENQLKCYGYGYIFHCEIYSKDEVESQSPQIREYIEHYKEFGKYEN